jgi:hypothetical protein
MARKPKTAAKPDRCQPLRDLIHRIGEEIAQIHGDLADPDIPASIKTRLRALLKKLIAQRQRLQQELAKCEEIGSDPLLR